MSKCTITKLIGTCMLALLIHFTPGTAHSRVDHSLFDNVLSQHVSDGQINFTNLCDDQRLGQYTDLLNQSDPAQISDQQEQIAFWLNVYNAYSMEAICAEYPIKSINELNFGGLIFSVLTKKSVWDQPIVKVNGKTYTLRHIDHGILRPEFADNRIQFAIACGTIGCAPARNEAYQGSTLSQQLADQTRTFVNDQRNNSFDLRKRRANLSTLFKWSRKDFGDSDENLLLFTAEYLPENLRSDIIENVDDWKVKFKKYDLTLNDKK